MVADMEVDMVAYTEVDKVADMVADEKSGRHQHRKFGHGVWLIGTKHVIFFLFCFTVQ